MPSPASAGSALASAAVSSAAIAVAAVGPAASAAPLALLPRSALLSLYRSTLRHAARFPSSKRKGIVRDIRLDWRQGAALSEAERCHAAQTRAVDGLKMLRQYVNLNTRNSGTW